MTKDDIKKALECCSSDVESCAKCPYDFACTRYLCKDALNLIAEQEKEIELLKMQLQDVVNHADTFLAEAQKFETKNAKLKAENEDLKDEIIYLERRIAIRDNALKDRDKAIEMLEGKQDTIVKQAKIDILNKVKDVLDNAPNGWAYTTYIDELIEEVENDK